MKYNFKDPQQFSDFVEKLEAGLTTETEEASFAKALDEMSITLEKITDILIRKKKA